MWGSGFIVLIAYLYLPINFLLCLKNKSKKEAKIQKSQKWKILGLEWKPTWALQGNKKVTRRILDPGKNGFLSETRWGLFLFLFLFFFLLVRSSFESARWKPERAPWQELESKRIECILGCSLFFSYYLMILVWCGGVARRSVLFTIGVDGCWWWWWGCSSLFYELLGVSVCGAEKCYMSRSLE